MVKPFPSGIEGKDNIEISFASLLPLRVVLIFWILIRITKVSTALSAKSSHIISTYKENVTQNVGILEVLKIFN